MWLVPEDYIALLSFSIDEYAEVYNLILLHKFRKLTHSGKSNETEMNVIWKQYWSHQ